MKTRTTLVAGGLLALSATLALLSGCDGARESVASAIRPANANEVAGALRQQIAQGKFAEASADGASYLKDKQDAGGVVAWEAAKASAQAGKIDDAVRFTELALRGGAVQAVNLMAEPLLEPVRTDLRFVALAAGGEYLDPLVDLTPLVGLTPASPAGAPAAGAGAEASVAAGAQAKAGDVSVSLPD